MIVKDYYYYNALTISMMNINQILIRLFNEYVNGKKLNCFERNVSSEETFLLSTEKSKILTKLFRKYQL